mgnify:CR=1 FL=1
MQYPTTIGLPWQTRLRVQRDTLGEILKDKTYLPHDSSSYRGFIADMKTAVDTGRHVTPKMFTAINKIIKTYHDWKDPSKWTQKACCLMLFINSSIRPTKNLQKAKSAER